MSVFIVTLDLKYLSVTFVLGTPRRHPHRLKSTEVRILVKIVSQDIRSNLNLISKETGTFHGNLVPRQVRELVKIPGVPDNQLWRTNLLQRLMRDRRQLESIAKNSDDINEMINSLCSS